MLYFGYSVNKIEQRGGSHILPSIESIFYGDYGNLITTRVLDTTRLYFLYKLDKLILRKKNNKYFTVISQKA